MIECIADAIADFILGLFNIFSNWVLDLVGGIF